MGPSNSGASWSTQAPLPPPLFWLPAGKGLYKYSCDPINADPENRDYAWKGVSPKESFVDAEGNKVSIACVMPRRIDPMTGRVGPAAMLLTCSPPSPPPFFS